MPMMELYLIFQFVKRRCHGNQIVVPQLRQTDTTCIFCRLPDGRSVSFRYYLLGGGIVAPSGLLARLCYAFLVFLYLKGRCYGNQFCEKMANSALSLLWHSETEWDNAVRTHDLIASLMPLYHVNFW